MNPKLETLGVTAERVQIWTVKTKETQEKSLKPTFNINMCVM